MINNIKVEEIKEDGTKVTINPNNDDSNINILTTFDSIIDLDLMILMMIQSEMNDNKNIDRNVMKLNLYDIKQKLISRKDECPVTVCVNDKSKALSIYTDIMTNKYSDLLKKYSFPTGLMQLMGTYIRNDNKVTILCRTEEEGKLIKKYDDKLPVIINQDYSKINCDDYTIMFLKSKNDVFRFKQALVKKHIFLLGYKFNLSFVEDLKEPLPDLEVSRALYPYSKLGFVNVYHKNEKINMIVESSDIKKNPTNK